MIATVAGPADASSAWKFRARPLGDWLPLFWPGLTFVDFQRAGREPGELLVLDQDILLIPGKNLAAAISLAAAARPEQAWTVPGRPFIVFGRNCAKKKSLLNERMDTSWDEMEAEVLELPGAERIISPAEDPAGLALALLSIQAALLEKAGVLVEDPLNFYLEAGIPIGPGSRLGPGVVISGESSIGADVMIGARVSLENTRVGDNCRILPGSLLYDTVLAENISVGPYAHLRQGCQIAADARIGNFVEMKKTSFGRGSKAMHLSYLGDARVGEAVNVGAGTITCNYDGRSKHATEIEDEAFIGSGSELVAPVKIGRGSYVGAGSTITQDVPEESLAVARQRQRNIEGWARKKKKD